MSREVAAPALRETAEVWWDAESDPVVTWEDAGDDAGTAFLLRDGGDAANVLVLWRSEVPVPAPEVVATALAEGLAACDFPPTGDGADPARAAATLRAAGLDA